MKQTSREAFARSRRIIDVAAQPFMQIVNRPCAVRHPLARIPASVKFSRTQNGFCALRHWQLRIENCAADFQMWIECFTRDEQPHDFAGAFKDCVHTTIPKESFNADWRPAAPSKR